LPIRKNDKNGCAADSSARLQNTEETPEKAMRSKSDDWEEQLGNMRFEQYIDPDTGFAHNTTIFPAGPVPPAPPVPPPPPRQTFLQRHPYFGPIIAAIITVTAMVILAILKFG
jgi:hypothetical protein